MFRNQIIAEIDAYMQSVGGTKSDWYVGITSDIRRRLFGDHRVSEQYGKWIHCRAYNDTEAREAEAAYHRTGHQGAGGGGDWSAVFVYAYFVTPGTVE